MSSERIVRHLAAMGTALSLTVSAPTREGALHASEAGVREIERIEALLSTWREDSPLARLNAAATGTAVELPAELPREAYRDVLTGIQPPIQQVDGVLTIAAGDIFDQLPISLLVSFGRTSPHSRRG